MATNRTTRLKSALNGNKNTLFSHANTNLTGGGALPRTITQT